MERKENTFCNPCRHSPQDFDCPAVDVFSVPFFALLLPTTFGPFVGGW